MATTANKEKLKIYIILGIEFVAIAILLLLIFFAGKRSYTVTFDLNGGTLLSGDLEQRVTQGHNANPPSVTKEGHYLRGWSGSYREVTRNVTVTAIWEYESGFGLEYDTNEGKNYCELRSAFTGLNGDLYIGAYYNDKKVLSVMDGAFSGCDRITGIYMLDGILTIGNEAFSGMSALSVIEVPSTVHTVGSLAFAQCVSLTELALPAKLEQVGAAAFLNCSSLERVILPMEGECYFSADSFEGCEALSEIVILSPELVLTSLDFIPEGVELLCAFTEEEATEEFTQMLGDITAVYGYSPESEEPADEDGDSDR